MQDKPFQILALLLRQPRKLILRHEILRSVWADTFVEGDLCLNVAVRRLRAALGDHASAPRFIETVGSRGYRFIGSVHAAPGVEAVPLNKGHPRVAVFPLKRLTRAEAGSIDRTMTEVLITQLRRMNPPFVIVTPEFTTERAHKGKGTLALCRAVSVDYVIVGSASRTAGQVRVTVRLLDCRAEACIWAESYTRTGEDLFGIQEEVGRNIACAVLQAIPVAVRPFHLQHVPAKAHASYLHGCAFLSRLTESGVERCLPLLDEAVREYPQFALAWAALANTYCLLARLGMQPSRKVFPKVKAFADRASEIEDLAEARTALAYYHLMYEHDWEAAEANLVRALNINPGYPLALGAYAQLLATLGKHQDAVRMLRQARDLDPFASYTGMMLGWALYYAADCEEALAPLRRSLELDPSLWMAHTSAGMVLERMGRLEEALAEFRLAVEHSANSALAKAHLAYGLAKFGDEAGAREILNALLKLRQKRYFSPYWVAVIHTALNAPAEALQWLQTAAEERSSWIVFAREDPKFADLRPDFRFRRIVEAINPPRAITFSA